MLKPYKVKDSGLITGDISEKNFKIADSKITLSPEGAKVLLKELEEYLIK
ncbi:hypothetical protein [Bacillus clarus]|uniref:AbrB C-terminal domain-containing protein n=1 Tax=Bacillus clarus TaxID=2338372 RepID=A0A090YCW8_9BACI|nr:hypothetical protein [Bacillus clarus]KFM95697.1 hypothetical protein DJ93_5449 [Bacillus clarus]